MTEASSRAAWLQEARSHLRDADPVLARLIDERPAFDPRAWMDRLPPMDLFGALLFQVTGQQLSVAATRRTLARIEDLFGGHLPSPAELLGVDPGKLREAGPIARARIARDSYTYLHLPMVAGIVLFAFGVKTTLSHFDAHLSGVASASL